MIQLIVVALGGALGAVSRYLVSGWVYRWTFIQFPTGTFAVNIIGSFFLGFLMTLFNERFIINPQWKSLITVGFIGAFTTFSTFMYESISLLQEREYLFFFLNTLGSLIVGLISVWLGIILAENI